MIKEFLQWLKHDESRKLISYYHHRRVIGIVGCLLPFILVVRFNMNCDDAEMLSSISAYYHTVSRDWFVGILFALGFFLYAYTGYDWEDLLGARIAAISAICIALFPTENCNQNCQTDLMQPGVITYGIHYLSAAIFFSALSYFCLRLFVKSSDPDCMTPNKILRNRVYRTCGWVMVVCLILIGLHAIWLYKISSWKSLDPVFWLEFIALEAFGISWLTKSEVLFPDEL